MMVAGLQLDITWEQPESNYHRVQRLLDGYSAEPRILVLPEMFATGFSMNSAAIAPFAEQTKQFLAGLARQRSCYVAGGYAEADDAGVRNVCSIMAPDGRAVLRYEKVHLFSPAQEHEHYLPGRTLFTVEVDGIRVTPLICYDLRFPELFRVVAAETDLFLVIANWPDVRRDAWCALLRARAIENQAFVLGVNRVGQGGKLHYCGDSLLLDPLGQTVVAAGGAETVMVGEIELDAVRDFRDKFPVLNDRRPDIYQALENNRG